MRRNDKYGQIMHDIAYHYPNAANNRLGNVTATIPDRKRLVLNAYGNMVYIPLPVSYTDYYPFGYSISDRNYYSGGGRVCGGAAHGAKIREKSKSNGVRIAFEQSCVSVRKLFPQCVNSVRIIRIAVNCQAVNLIFYGRRPKNFI